MINDENGLVVQEDFQKVDLGTSATELHFRACTFLRVSFSEAPQAVFERCSFDACDFRGAYFADVSFIGCRFDGCIFNKTVFDGSGFLDCELIGVELIECSLYATRFVETDLPDSSILGCDARFATFESCLIDNASLDDTDFSDANIEGLDGLLSRQLALTNGNVRTILPSDVEPPEDWTFEEEEVSDADEDGVPGQVSAPLRVVWRGDRLVPDPRGASEEDRKNASVTFLFQAFSSDVFAITSQPTGNHPIFRHVISLEKVVKSGLASLNPVGVGYYIEMLKAQISSARDELSEATAGQLDALIVAGDLLASQFTEWRDLVSRRDTTNAMLIRSG